MLKMYQHRKQSICTDAVLKHASKPLEKAAAE